MWKILQDNIKSHNNDNFGSLPANTQELELATWREELNNLLPCITIAQGGKHPLSLTSIEEKNRFGSRNLAKTKMELHVARFLDLLLKSNKII